MTILSGDVHSASVYQIENEAYPSARIYNATSSAISRKPAPAKAELFIRKTGKMEGYDGYASRIYAKSGDYNFLVINVDVIEGETEINLELCWPNGKDGELAIKRISLAD